MHYKAKCETITVIVAGFFKQLSSPTPTPLLFRGTVSVKLWNGRFLSPCQRQGTQTPPCTNPRCPHLARGVLHTVPWKSTWAWPARKIYQQLRCFVIELKRLMTTLPLSDSPHSDAGAGPPGWRWAGICAAQQGQTDAHLVLTAGTVPGVAEGKGGSQQCVEDCWVNRMEIPTHREAQTSEGRSTGCLLGLRLNTRVTRVRPLPFSGRWRIPLHLTQHSLGGGGGGRLH